MEYYFINGIFISILIGAAKFCTLLRKILLPFRKLPKTKQKSQNVKILGEFL